MHRKAIGNVHFFVGLLARARSGVFDLGGDAVDPRWVRRILAAGGPRRLLHVYGPTEATTLAPGIQSRTLLRTRRRSRAREPASMEVKWSRCRCAPVSTRVRSRSAKIAWSRSES